VGWGVLSQFHLIEITLVSKEMASGLNKIEGEGMGETNNTTVAVYRKQ
jgi:hypothetical protein